jgi:methionyl-tRNA formyltransferase
LTIRVLFMSTPSFGVPTLQLLAADDRFEIVGVVTQPDKPAGRGLKLTSPPIKSAARALGIQVLQPPTLDDPAVQEGIRALKPDVGAVVAYGQWIPSAVFDLPPKRTLNLHPSMLPRHRGAAPVLGAILAGESEVGLSVLFIENEMDVGDLLAQKSVPIGRNDTTGSVMAKLAPIGAPFFVETLASWVTGRIKPQSQDHSKATWIGRQKKEAGRIDWSWSAKEIDRRCRAFSPWPGIFARFAGKRLLLHRVRALNDWNPTLDTLRPGTVVRMDSRSDIAVVTGSGLLGLDRVQLANRKSLNIHEFICGQREFIGTTLE